MKLSTRARYGLRLCFLLGVATTPSISLSNLVKQTDLSEKYLEQILMMLRRKGLISATRGVNGGYSLVKKPQEISINEILTALDDSFEISDCTSDKCKDKYCPNRNIFKKIYGGVNEILDHTTLKDMIDDYKCI